MLPTKFSEEKSWFFPSFAYIKSLLSEKKERFLDSGVKGKNLFFNVKTLSLGCSSLHYRFFCMWQLKALYTRKFQINYTGLKNIPTDKPCVFVMKHRGYADITLHGFGYAWATSKLYANDPDVLKSDDKIRKIISEGEMSRFLMKEDLLSLPIGFHLVLNGGIPIPQDHETKALNNPGYDSELPSVQKKIKQMASWFSFKNSYREIMNILKSKKSVMIYGEATRVSRDKMGHLSTKFLTRLKKIEDVQFIPVGSVWTDKTKMIHYGESCPIEDLREKIAELSEIPKSNFL